MHMNKGGSTKGAGAFDRHALRTVFRMHVLQQSVFHCKALPRGVGDVAKPPLDMELVGARNAQPVGVHFVSRAVGLILVDHQLEVCNWAGTRGRGGEGGWLGGVRIT